jgi:hypothetical protein
LFGTTEEAAEKARNCHSEPRSLFEWGEELCPIACFLRDESAFLLVYCKKQIPRSACLPQAGSG